MIILHLTAGEPFYEAKWVYFEITYHIYKKATVLANWDETLVNKPYVNEVTLRGQKPP